MRKISFTFFVVFLCLFNVLSAFAEPVNIYLFHGKTCPHCLDEEAYLDELVKEYPEGSINLNLYEVWYDEENGDLMKKFSDHFGFEPTGVPLTFIGSSYWTGFGDSTKEKIHEAIDNQIKTGEFVDTAEIVKGIIKTEGGELSTTDEITLPLFGKISLKNKSSLFVTIAVGLAD